MRNPQISRNFAAALRLQKTFISKIYFLAPCPLVISDCFSLIADMTDATGPKSDPGQMPIHDVDDLLGPDQRAGLMLNGVLYILRVTKSGKLILTK